MGSRPYYKRYPSDFITGCLSLTLEEKGAYSMVIDMIFDRGDALPNDPGWIARVCSCSVRKWQTLLNALVAKGKLFLTPEGYIHAHGAQRRLDKESEEARKFAENGVKNGRKPAENAVKTDPKEAENPPVFNDYNDLAEKSLTENTPPLIPIPIPLPDSPAVPAGQAAGLAGEGDVSIEAVDPPPKPQPRAKMPRLEDHTGKWAAAFPSLDWSLDANAQKEPGVYVNGIFNSLAPACRAICRAAKMYDPDWRGDWDVVVAWMQEGLSASQVIIPAIQEQVDRRGDEYRQPNRLIAFQAQIRRYAQRGIAA